MIGILPVNVMRKLFGPRGERHASAREHLQWKAIRPWWFKIAETLHEMPFWAQSALASGMVMLSFLARHNLVADRQAYLYVFFMPAILLASTVLRHGSGILAVVFSAILIKVFLVPPPFSPWFTDHDDAVAIAVFVVSGLVTAVMGSALHNALFGLAAAYERLAAAERQNALLLDELTHRFKNDLANLTAILRLQAKDVSDPQARSQLMIASERVGVLSRLHERLTGSPKNTEVDSREFLSEVCNDLRVSAIGARPITIRTELDPIELPFEAAISVGLIVNELVQNALKYAFPGERPGTIQVTLRQMGDEAHLTIADDGIGNSPRSTGSSGLGQRLVASFAQQLGGSLEVRTEKGRMTIINFPAPRKGPPTRTRVLENRPELDEPVL